MSATRCDLQNQKKNKITPTGRPEWNKSDRKRGILFYLHVESIKSKLKLHYNHRNRKSYQISGVLKGWGKWNERNQEVQISRNRESTAARVLALHIINWGPFYCPRMSPKSRNDPWAMSSPDVAKKQAKGMNFQF